MEAREPGARAEGASPLLRLAIEMGPLVAFFVTNARTEDIFAATKVFMVAILLALGLSWRLERRLPVMPLVTCVFVLVFGGLTLWLDNELFIKLKPTVVNALFAAILLGGLATGRSLVKVVFGTAVSLTDEGWRALTLRWALYFVFLALLNEVVWRNVSTDAWVTFKVWGLMPLTILFSLLQVPLLNRCQLPAAGEGAASPDADA